LIYARAPEIGFISFGRAAIFQHQNDRTASVILTFIDMRLAFWVPLSAEIKRLDGCPEEWHGFRFNASDYHVQPPQIKFGRRGEKQ
jgi:hypothetical protein